MQLTIFGSGYVGLVTGVCFAEKGHHVTFIDVNEKRIADLNRGHCPIYEPGLQNMMLDNLGAGRLAFTTTCQEAITQADILFIAVGTPPDDNGAADLTYIRQVAQTIGQNLQQPAIIVNKSTVPVGTADEVHSIVSQHLQNRQLDIAFSVASVPEFLKEGAAVQDCLYPERIIIGTHNTKTSQQLAHLFEAFCHTPSEQIIIMQTRSAELTKYAANAMLATKISFMNEVSQIAQQTGADIDEIKQGMGSDSRIGYKFINPGCGFGGSCFPKDVQALQHIAESHQYHPLLLEATNQVNQNQKQILFNKLTYHFNNDLEGKTIGIWGLAFKPNTDDIREAPSRTLIERLWDNGAHVQAYDPQAMDNFKALYGDRSDYHLVDSAYEALLEADALVIVTEWCEFKQGDFNRIKSSLRYPLVIDGRNLFSPQTMRHYGLTYDSIGRP